MEEAVFKGEALARVKSIHELSRLCNKQDPCGHNGLLLKMMRHHVDEIEELFRKNDRHFLIETGDLIILCLELLLENGAVPDDVILKCFGRFETKLKMISGKKD